MIHVSAGSVPRLGAGRLKAMLALILISSLPSASAATETPFGPESGSAPQATMSVSSLRQEIELIPCGLCENMVDFEDVLGGPDAGTPYDEILVSGNVSFAERLTPQPLSYVEFLDNTYDELECLASLDAPLTLLPGEANQNTVVFHSTNLTENVIAGLGPSGWPDLVSIGEGALALILPTDAAYLGFDIVGAHPEFDNQLWLCFYDRNATLIDIVSLEDFNDGCYAFRRSGGEIDIAALSIHNLDYGGIGYDDFCFGVETTGVEDVDFSRVKSMY